MPATCDPNALLQASACFDCIPLGAHPRVQTYLLAVMAGLSLDPNVLLAQAACFACLDGRHDMVQDYLLCKLNGA